MNKTSKKVTSNSSIKKLSKTEDGVTVKKSIIRNPLGSLKKTAVKTVNLQLGVEQKDNDVPSEVIKMGEGQQIQNIAESSSQVKFKTSKDKSESNEKIQEEVKRVNIPFGQKKYKDLVDLGSLEAVLAETSAETNAEKSNRRRVCLPKKDPEPVLSDYYTPRFDTEYIFTFPPTPVTLTKEWHYNPSAVVDVLDQLQSDNSDS